MASRARTAALVDKLLAGQSKVIRQAFLEAIRDARASVRLQDVVDALSRGDIEAAARTLEIPRTFMAPLDRAVSTAYYEAGKAHNELMMQDVRRAGLTVVIRFDPGAPQAAGWVRQHSSTLITEIVQDQRLAVREALGAGLDTGRGPRAVALDIVGRIDKATGRRVGGIVGLTSGQARAVENARAELASGDLASYLERKLRDRRFDPIVRRAILDEKPLAALDVRRIADRYSDRMLAYRGEVIGRTEALTSLSHAQNENVRQMLEAAGIRPETITKRWSARADGRTRDSHSMMNGQTKPLDEPFVSPTTGARMMYPRDTSFGAPASEIVSCRCFASFSMDLSKG